MISYILDQIQLLLLSLVSNLFGPADQFKTAGMLFFLLLIPAYIIFYILWYSPRRLLVPLSYNPEKITHQKNYLSLFRYVPMLLQLSALSLMIIALARPISALELEEKSAEGIDIMLVLDTSGSMETDDFQPNRLEVAKDRAIRFIEGRVDDRIGIVLFAEDAFSYAPLTLDYDLLKKQIAAVNSNIMPKEGTAMGSAVGIAINRMLESKSPSKVMIILTDGSSNRGQLDPITASQLAKENNIKIYCIGIGKEEFQRQTFLGTQTIKSEVDEPTMKKIAETTNGKFFRAEDPKGLDEIFEMISRMEKTEIKDERYREETDVYAPILAWAGILLAASFLLLVTFLSNPLEE